MDFPSNLRCITRDSNTPPRPNPTRPQALLELEEEGILEDIAEPYFDSSVCAYLEEYEEQNISSQNLTLVDMGGVFLVLFIFVVVSLVSWLFRRSPPAKKKWKEYYDRREERYYANLEAMKVP